MPLDLILIKAIWTILTSSLIDLIIIRVLLSDVVLKSVAHMRLNASLFLLIDFLEPSVDYFRYAYFLSVIPHDLRAVLFSR